MSNIQTVQEMYAAFGRGDIPGILARLSADVAWDPYAIEYGIPWLKARKGIGEIPAFFESLGGLEFQRFEPKTLLESGNTVVSILAITVVVKATGRTIAEEDEVHIWQFDDAGKVIQFAHKTDTHQTWLALQGE